MGVNEGVIGCPEARARARACDDSSSQPTGGHDVPGGEARSLCTTMRSICPRGGTQQTPLQQEDKKDAE
eukprot:7675447-Pyramimonas_sp.AAC.1